MFTQFEVETKQHDQLVDITKKITKIIEQWHIKNGSCLVFVPHTTAAVTINESADSSVKRDILSKLKDIVPWQDDYEHLEGNSAAHIKASLFGNSENIIVKEGSPVLGTWQGIFLAEFDGPRTRKIKVKLVADEKA
ncbi:MAG: secondary thiamine-phosphate synthase enzyme YjbQ [Bacillota bacterium]